MNTHENQRTADEPSTPHAARVQRILHGQRAPQASTGWGRRVLFQCPFCRRPWLMDGPQSQVDLEPGALRQTAAELHADLTDLPTSPCAPCARAQARFRIDRDEYVTTHGRLIGYGFNVEGDAPPGMHFVALVHHADELLRHLTGDLDLHAHVPVYAEQEQQTWTWLAHLPPPPAANEYVRGREPGDPNPPGHDAPGTATWHWSGALWITDCPPLAGSGLVHLALALPPDEQASVFALVTLCRAIARGVLNDPTFFA